VEERKPSYKRTGGDCIMISFMICTPHQTAYYSGNQLRRRRDGHVARRGFLTKFWWGRLRERDYWKELGVEGEILLKLIFQKYNGGTWTRLIWLRIEKSGGNETSGCIKCGGIF
jgi:hypothetical protein